jgi:hypothetical protein
MANVYTPDKPESRHQVHATPEDRKKHAEQFREQKAHEQKLKDERFAAIRERRKKGPGGSGGINIEVTGGE